MAYLGGMPDTVTAQIRSRRGETINLALPPTCTVGDLRAFFINDYHYPPHTCLLYNGTVAADNTYVSAYPYGSLLLATADDVYGSGSGGLLRQQQPSPPATRYPAQAYHSPTQTTMQPPPPQHQQQQLYARPTQPTWRTNGAVAATDVARAQQTQPSMPAYHARVADKSGTITATQPYTQQQQQQLQEQPRAAYAAAPTYASRQPRYDAPAASPPGRASAHASPSQEVLAPPSLQSTSSHSNVTPSAGATATTTRHLAEDATAGVAAGSTSTSMSSSASLLSRDGRRPREATSPSAHAAAATRAQAARAAATVGRPTAARTGSASRSATRDDGDYNNNNDGDDGDSGSVGSATSGGRRRGGRNRSASRDDVTGNNNNNNNNNSAGGARMSVRDYVKTATVPAAARASSPSASSRPLQPPRPRGGVDDVDDNDDERGGGVDRDDDVDDDRHRAALSNARQRPAASRASSTRSHSSRPHSSVQGSTTTTTGAATGAAAAAAAGPSLSHSSTPRPRASLTIECVIPALRRTAHVHVSGDASVGDLLLAIVAAVPEVAGDATLVYQGKPLPESLDHRLFNLGIRDDARVFVASGEYSNVDHLILVELEDEVAHVAAKLAQPLTATERKGYYEALMRLLFRTDGLQNLEGAWKQRRKDTVRRITELQDQLHVDAS